jgi:phosphatidylserine decarboxylase
VTLPPGGWRALGLINMYESRIHNKWPFAKEGLPFILSGLGVALLLLFFDLEVLSVLVGLFTLFAAYFFRDPERKIPSPDNAILPPADGRIVEVAHLNDGANPLGVPAKKLSIFMSVFSVHINRIPISGLIENVTYQPGKFFSANLDKASQENERNQITLLTKDSRKIVFIQIAGLIARRIACWVRESDTVEAGQRFGLIRFGSRLEIYVPEDTRIMVTKGQTVKAGETIIGYLS